MTNNVVKFTGKTKTAKTATKKVADKAKVTRADVEETLGVKAKTATKKVAAKAASKAYKNHREGSRKGAVRKVFDEKGREKAFAFGESQKLKASTLNQWMNTWAREVRVSA